MTSARKIVLVTGGNNGIGYEIVKALLQSKRPYHVLMGSRSLERAHSAISSLRSEVSDTSNTVEPVQVDLDNDESIEKAYAQLKDNPSHLDVLVNNAGAAFDYKYLNGQVTLRECFNLAYNTNVAGTNVLTHTLMPLLLKSSDPRLIFVAGLANQVKASEKYFPTVDFPAGWPKTKEYFETIGYRCSKTALNMLMLDWNHRLKNDGVKVWAVGPGFLETDLGGARHLGQQMNAGHPSAGGLIIRSVVEGERDADVGKIVVKDGLSTH